LFQGHAAWDGFVHAWGDGLDAALHFYERALIYALRFNRYLLDELLGGRSQGSTLRAIIPHCLARGEQGSRMLAALRDWWGMGVNDVGISRPDTVSLIGEGISLVAGEHEARARERGDKEAQRSVIDRINRALQQAKGVQGVAHVEIVP
jgi:hypothetical protein